MDDFNNSDELNLELNIVYRYLCKLGIPPVDAEDAVQETAYKFLVYFDSIRTSKIRNWLIRVALNFYYDQCRKQRRYDLNLDLDLLEISIRELPEEIFLRKERNIELENALSRIKPHYRELLLLKYQSGLSYEEISKLLEMNLSSIKTNLFRARKQLATIYREVNDER